MLDERPSKKQQEVLKYIDEFIKSNGFGPSYREMMRALGLKSVSTVATHVDSLIAKGFLEKRENSARSLRVIPRQGEIIGNVSKSSHIDWLRQEIAKRTRNDNLSEEVAVLEAALELLDQTDD